MLGVVAGWGEMGAVGVEGGRLERVSRIFGVLSSIVDV